jgi:isoleucyl-tRNA synthetase
MVNLKDTLTMPKGTFPMRANLAQRETALVEKYKKISLYQMLLKHNEGKPAFYLHDGPPYANGEIHAGHALNKIIKDIILRSKNLEGFEVPYTPGWDTHGLPIELMVTKSGVNRKTTPAVDFRKKCHDYALSQVVIQKGQMERLLVLGDYDHPYLTLNKDYEANQVKVFAKMALDGLIYKGLKPVIWSWSSESALAEAEVEYKDVHATTLYFRFPVEQGNYLLQKGDSFLVWTTTGWTIPGNEGLCLNPKLEYGLYETEKGNFVFLKSALEMLSKDCGFEKAVLKKTFLGEDVEGLKVRHPYQNRLVPVCVDNYVTSDSGTGIVHLGPGHGADDYRVGKKYGLPILCTVDSRGVMNENAGKEMAGLFYEDCSKKVIETLKENGNLIATKEIVHAYPHDWRTKKPVIFRATTQWFCSIGKIKDKLLTEADKVGYIPSWGKVRFKNMLSDRDDWCISRQRLWGVPIPIFYGEDKEPILDEKVFDHIEELFQQYGSDIWYEKEPKDLLPEGYTSIHSPNGTFTKEKDIMDVWFDSGSSFLGSDISLNHPFPADVYFEGNDQYRGWYNSSMILSVATTGKAPYKNIITHGFLVDQNGDKFSKSKKNGIDPRTICNTFGADILRLWTTTIDYTQAEIPLSQDLLRICSDQYRKIRNTFKFMLSNLQDDDCGAHYDPSYNPEQLSLVDSMILNRLRETLHEMQRGYDAFDFKKVSDVLINFFVNDLSSFYLDFRKDTLYCEKKDSVERRNTQYVLFTICKSLAIAYSPVLPFTAEEIYEALPLSKRLEDVALESYPELGDIDAALSDDYRTLLLLRAHVTTLLEPVRASKGIGSSQEASVLYAPADDKEKKLLAALGNEECQKIFIVSSFAVSDKSSCTKSKGVKCDRCWNYFDNTEEIDGQHLCPRCAGIVKGLK